ncbi:hypothetical protein WN943_008830 [Citrus x changshan-huyou]
MARGEWGYQGLWRGKWCCSYKKTTLLICFINIVIALYVLRSIYASIYVFSRNDLKVVKYTPDQIRNMEESVRIRRDNEPMALVKLVNGLKQEFSRDESVFELPRAVKLRMIDEILRRLQSSDVKGNVSAQRVEIELPGYTLFIVNGKPSDSVKDIHLDDTVQWHLLFIIEAVESWRREKLEEAKQLSIGRQGINSTILQEEARMLVRVLESDWAALSEEIGLWIPTEIIHKEHGDKPKGVEDEDLDEDVLPGRPPPPECHAELHTDYDGVAIRWGLTHHRDSAADCCQACIEQAKRAKPGQMKCNIWVYCPAETGCHSPDKYEHKYQECWLKYAEKPKLNFKDRYSEKYRNAHPAAPLVVPWVSGVIGKTNPIKIDRILNVYIQNPRNSYSCALSVFVQLPPTPPSSPFPSSSVPIPKWKLNLFPLDSTMIFGERAIEETHYDILSVRVDASYEEIRTGYRSAILNYHPDKLQNTSELSDHDHESGDRFLKVQKAWEILSNSRSRAVYDSELRASRQGMIAAEDVSLEDMMIEENGEVLDLFYQCRCGDCFSIDSMELDDMGYTLLKNGNKISLQSPDTSPASVILPCGSCSLHVRLLVNADIEVTADGHL